MALPFPFGPEKQERIVGVVGYNLKSMLRLSSAIACLLLAACSSPDTRPVQSFGANEPSLVAPPPSAPLLEMAAPTEAELRELIAHAEDPVPPCLSLIQQLDLEERLPAARSVLDQALSRVPDAVVLQVARAGVLRDLGQRHLAVAALGQIVMQQGADRIHPGLLFELAELQVLEGDGRSALATLLIIRQMHGGEDWVQAHGADLTELNRAANNGKPLRLRMRDLMGNLRGAPDPTVRTAALLELNRVGGVLAARAVAVAGEDVDPLVRASAVRLAQIDAVSLPELVAVGLADEAPAVRCAAALRASELQREAATELLVPALSIEEIDECYQAIQKALLCIDPLGPSLDPTLLLTQSVRAANALSWRQRWSK
jgi:hypothetical protein